MTSSESTVLTGDDLARTLARVAHEIVERHPDPASLVVVGIQRRGAVLARRLHGLIADLVALEPPYGDVDITFYRDDVRTRYEAPTVHGSTLDAVDIDGRSVVLVDDVLYTGRTVRAAMEALFDYGRPARVQLAVLVDRGHRELPFRADYVGKNLPTARAERVRVRVAEVDGEDAVRIVRAADAPAPGAADGPGEPA